MGDSMGDSLGGASGDSAAIVDSGGRAPFAAAEASPFAAPPGESPFAAPDDSSPFAAPPSTDAAVAAELAAYAPAGQPVAANATFGASVALLETNRAVTFTGADADLVPAAENPVRAFVAMVLGSRRNIAIAAGSALLLVIVLAFALGGSSDSPKTVASKPEMKAPVVEPTPEKAPAEPVDETPDVRDDERVAVVETPTEPPTEAAAGSGAQVEPTNPGATAAQPRPAGVAGTAKVATGVKAPVRGGSKKTLGGKQVVLEYDAQAKEAAKPAAAAPRNEQAAILKARAAYAQGNQKLMAGDWNGAILKYRQSLANYPGYVAGYRGLGLAFMQKGDKPKALQALRLYLSSVPAAKDAALIKKRIATLQK